jgi:hypothetical protein
MDNTDSTYGAWISRNDYIPVKYENHYDSALSILHELYNFPDSKIRGRHYSIYKIMARLGYIRLVYSVLENSDHAYIVEYWQRARLSHFQKNVINEAIGIHFSKVYDSDYTEQELSEFKMVSKLVESFV